MPDAPRPTSDVAGDALIAECESHAAVLSMPHTPFQLEQLVNFLVATVPHVVRALVARVTDLEARVGEYGRDKEKLHDWGSEWKRRARAAEAQVAVSNHAAMEYRREREAAEAALAEARQALTEIAEGRCDCGGTFRSTGVQLRCDGCDRHKGYGVPDYAKAIARRALAATGPLGTSRRPRHDSLNRP